MCGPQEIVERRLVCDGCSALKTERWDYYDENDYHESGTGADCLKANKRITAQWYEKHNAPEWCPALPANTCGALRKLEAGRDTTMTVLDLADDDALRYAQRVLESQAPEEDRKRARDMIVAIRTRLRKTPHCIGAERKT